MMDIKNYLQYYIGHARFRYRYFDYADDEWSIWSKLTSKRYLQVTDDASISAIQLQLRPLEDMTEEEAIDIVRPIAKYGDYKQAETYRNGNNRIVVSWGLAIREKCVPELLTTWAPAQFHYLLSHAFDIFGLIPAGLAEAKKQNP